MSVAARGLRDAIEAACEETGATLTALTVLAAQNDPYRVDTPSGHRDGEWLAVTAESAGLGVRVIHLRGLHYLLVSAEVTKPNGLPSTPLKDTERRADKWRTATGVAQTEIDALASLRPELLDRIVRDTLNEFYDHTLERRVRQARTEWTTEAQARVDASLDPGEVQRIRSDAALKLAQLEREIEALNEALRIDVSDIALPEISIPIPEIEETEVSPLVDSSWTWTAQTASLKASKDYQDMDVAELQALPRGTA